MVLVVSRVILVAGTHDEGGAAQRAGQRQTRQTDGSNRYPGRPDATTETYERGASSYNSHRRGKHKKKKKNTHTYERGSFVLVSGEARASALRYIGQPR